MTKLEARRRVSRTVERKKIKKKKNRCVGLTRQDIEFLNKNTRYDEEEIKEWYRGFKKDCPGGLLCKDKVLEMYTMILPEGNAVNFVDQIFRVFDKDGDGTIDFKEFMLATDMTSSGSPEEKLRWAFKMYDKDASGSIELREMVEIVSTLYDMEGVGGIKAPERARAIFSDLDFDGDGMITEEEFISGCMEDKDLMATLHGENDDAGSDEF